MEFLWFVTIVPHECVVNKFRQNVTPCYSQMACKPVNQLNVHDVFHMQTSMLAKPNRFLVGGNPRVTSCLDSWVSNVDVGDVRNAVQLHKSQPQPTVWHIPTTSQRQSLLTLVNNMTKTLITFPPVATFVGFDNTRVTSPWHNMSLTKPGSWFDSLTFNYSKTSFWYDMLKINEDQTQILKIHMQFERSLY